MMQETETDQPVAEKPHLLVYICEIEEGALVAVPVFERHPRGKNWFAKIHRDPAMPAGLARDFAKHAKGEFYYIVPDWLKPGVAVEFGADYYTASGRKQSSRWYGVVTAVSESGVEIEHHPTAVSACKAAKEMPILEGAR